MAKKYSLKFWILFWGCATLFLVGWFVYWEGRNHGVGSLVSSAISYFPFDENQKKEYQAISMVADYLMRSDDQPKKILLLFQNNLELRPGGGFIGAFGIVTILNGKVMSIQTHDVSNFDERIPDTVKPPYPMEQTLRISSWKLRDSNYSPDFETNAKKAEEFYRMGGGQEQFDAVIGLTTNVLTSMLKITGPIQIEGYPGTYDSENAIISLEYQVEKAFEQQGISRADRKSIMTELAQEIEKRTAHFSVSQKIAMAKILLEDLNSKDIQLYFHDEQMQKFIKKSSWAGEINRDYENDYLMMVDANLGAFKSDYYVQRSIEYTVDFSADRPQAHLRITYNHTAETKDWMTKDYLTYLRVYVPEGSWLSDAKNFDNVQYADDLGKRCFGAIVRVPIGSQKTVELNYTLPEKITEQKYALLLQKQAGVKNLPLTIHIIGKEGTRKDVSRLLDGNFILRDGIEYFFNNALVMNQETAIIATPEVNTLYKLHREDFLYDGYYATWRNY